MKLNVLEEISALRAARIACALITKLKTGEQILWHKNVSLQALDDQKYFADPKALQEGLDKCLQSRKSQKIMIGDEAVFFNLYLPSPKMIIIGAVHIAQALVKMASLSDYEIVVIDPRSAFATAERFPNVNLFAEWPQEIWDEVKIDAHSALIALTHDPKVDDWPLKQALDAGCFYVGALGSRKTHAKRLERLIKMGGTKAQVEKIHAPIGKNIGATNPVEIAVAVLAEVIEARRV